jgi:hypothetical protein
VIPTPGELFQPGVTNPTTVFGQRRKKKPNQASSADELIDLIKRVLESPEIKSAAVSLIARSEDAIREKEAKARTVKDTADAMSEVARQQGGESPSGSDEAK